jgi:hypothetical protein
MTEETTEIMNETETDKTIKKMTKEQRYYALHREQKIAKDLERYHNRPDIIAKREERERKKAEKEAEKTKKKMEEKELKQQEKERIRQEKLQLALQTSHKYKKTNQLSGGALTEFLNGIPPVNEIDSK